MNHNRPRNLTILLPLGLVTLIGILAAIGLRGATAVALLEPDHPPFDGEPISLQLDIPNLPQADSRAAANENGPDYLTRFEAGIPNDPPGGPSWVTFDGNDDADGINFGQYFWGGTAITNGIAYTGSLSLWAIGAGLDGQGLDANSDNYPDNVDAWLVYGPVNLTGISEADLNFDYLYEATTDNSSFKVVVSTDGINFTGSEQTFGSGIWQTVTFDPFNDLVGEETVYIAFNFASVAPGDGAGVFIDNFEITSEPLDDTYLPVVALMPSPTPSPTPTPLPGVQYRDDFTTDVTGWEDRERDLFEDVNNIVRHIAEGYLEVEITGDDDYGIISPLEVGPEQPYTLETRFRFVTPENLDEVGLVYGADYTNMSKSCPDVDDQFRSCFNSYYVVRIKWREGGSAGDALEASITKVGSVTTNNRPVYTTIAGPIRIDPTLADPNDWNTFKLQVEADNDLKFFVNTEPIEVLKATDNEFLDQLYFGVMVTSPPLQGATKAQFDYYQIAAD